MIYPLTALLTNDAVIFGVLMAILAIIFTTSHSKHPFWQKFYKFVPALLLCYFIPSLLSTFGIVHEPDSNLYFVASRYLLPACLVLLTLSIDFKGVLNLGPKALIMFITGTAGIMIGGPLAIIIVGFFNPEIVGGVGPDEVWRGLSTVAGSWIGGGANQAAMYEVFGPSDELFGAMVTVDILVASVWLAFLLYGAGMSEKLDKWFKADSSAIHELRDKIEAYRETIARVPSFLDFVKLGAIAFIITALGHLGGDTIAPWIAENSPLLASFSLDSSFFWLIVIATTGGLLISFTRFRELEGAGASKIGSLFIYILVMTIGMKMNIASILDAPGYFVIGAVWILVHITLLLFVGYLIKAPFFFTAVGSQANIGGAASAPIVASAFHPALAPVGVLLAVLGYALGTYGAYITALLMQGVS
jgi:uncharacterized membrane protein